jgi:hypothetical protein
VIGPSAHLRLVAVCHSARGVGGVIRLASARRAVKAEQNPVEKGQAALAWEWRGPLPVARLFHQRVREEASNRGGREGGEESVI